MFALTSLIVPGHGMAMTQINMERRGAAVTGNDMPSPSTTGL